MIRPNLKPRGKWIFVKQDEEKSRQSEYGIITPSNVEQEKKAFGTVLSVGSEITDIKEGARVVFGAYAGEQVHHQMDDGTSNEYRLLHDDDVIAFDEGFIDA